MCEKENLRSLYLNVEELIAFLCAHHIPVLTPNPNNDESLRPFNPKDPRIKKDKLSAEFADSLRHFDYEYELILKGWSPSRFEYDYSERWRDYKDSRALDLFDFERAYDKRQESEKAANLQRIIDEYRAHSSQ